MDNVENLVKVARELKSNERKGTVGTSAYNGAKYGARAGAVLGAIGGLHSMRNPLGAMIGGVGGTIAGGVAGGVAGVNYGAARALYRDAKNLKSVHPNRLKD